MSYHILFVIVAVSGYFCPVHILYWHYSLRGMNICRSLTIHENSTFLDSLAPPSSLSVNSGVSTERPCFKPSRCQERGTKCRTKGQEERNGLQNISALGVNTCIIAPLSLAEGIFDIYWLSGGVAVYSRFSCWYATNVLNHAGSPVLECKRHKIQ